MLVCILCVYEKHVSFMYLSAYLLFYVLLASRAKARKYFRICLCGFKVICDFKSFAVSYILNIYLFQVLRSNRSHKLLLFWKRFRGSKTLRLSLWSIKRWKCLKLRVIMASADRWYYQGTTPADLFNIFSLVTGWYSLPRADRK